MRDLISDTAKWGDLTVGPRIIDERVRKNMAAALQKIRTGEFARQFIEEMRRGGKRYQKLIKRGREHPMERTGRRLRALMGWRK
jgi:ketol-acid reductoisomerase